MDLTLDALIVLDAIDRKGSFAAAAEALYRVPSAISYTVQKLEQDLDTPIFDRSGHRAILTPAGKSLLDEGRHILRSANDLECHVKRIVTGWEAELCIAVDTILPQTALLPLIHDFYKGNSGTRLQVRREVLGGSWDALITGRADLIIGASSESPPDGSYSSVPLGEIEMVFAVAPSHPLASSDEPISNATLLQHRAVAVADTSRQLTPRTSGLLTGQDVLTVADMEAKLEAQIQGLGVGYLPLHRIKPAVEKGTLIIKSVESPRSKITILLAWRIDHQGKALKWFVDELKKPGIQNQLFTL